MVKAISLKRSILYISIIATILFWGGEKAAYWVFLLLALGNIKRLPMKHFHSHFFRMTCYSLPLIIPVFFHHEGLSFKADNWLAVVLPIIIGSFFIAFKWKEYKLFFYEGMFADDDNLKAYIPLLFVYCQIFCVISEELFFRFFLINGERNAWAILLSSLLFVCYHYSLEWGDFSKGDYLRQFLVGIINGALFISFNSMLPCVIVHFILDMPEISRNVYFLLLKIGVIKRREVRAPEIDF